MQVSLEATSGLERRLTITVPAEQVEAKVTERLKDTAKKVRLDGFRPGKVPLSVVKRRFGKSTRQEVVGDVMQSSFIEAIQKESLRPAGMPTVEPVKMEPGEDFEFIATFEVYPELALKGYEGITIEKPSADVTDADVEQMLETLRNQNREWQTVEREAKDGDQLIIDFVGRKDGEEFEGGKGEDFKLELGSGQMIEGFESSLVGSKAGEEKVINVTFPEDYQAESLAGQPAEFTIQVKEVAEAVLPELNDEFFAKFGVADGGLDAFKAEVRKNMERELQHAIKNKVKNQVMDGLLAENEVDVPKALLDDEINRMRQQAAQQIFGGENQVDPAKLPAELFQDRALKRVKLGLVVAEVVKQHDITVDDERVKALVEDIASAYEQPEQVVSWYYSNERQMSEVRSIVLEDQVVDTVLDTAQVTVKECSYEEAIKPAQESEAKKEQQAETDVAS